MNDGLFAVASAGFVALAVGLFAARPGGPSRIARGFAALLAAAWTALLAANLLELLTSVDPDSDALNPIGGLLQAIALLGLGVTVVRARRWTGWRRFWPLGLAVYYVAVLLAPGIAGVDSSVGTETVWALGYAVLGAALVVEQRTAEARTGR